MSFPSKHVRNVRERELEPGATCAKFAQVQTEGDRTVTRDVDHYNLDVIISVGYRVKSCRVRASRVIVLACVGPGLTRTMSNAARARLAGGIYPDEQTNMIGP